MGDKDLGAIVEMGGDPQNPFTSMVSGVSKALMKMAEILPQEGVSQDLVDQLNQLEQSYKQLLQQILQSVGGQQGQQAAPDKSVNAGPGARPAL